jgi:signal transduction histidine kinase
VVVVSSRPWHAAGVVVLSSAAEFALRGWLLTGLGRRVALLAADFVVLLVVLALADGGPAFFGCAAGWAALSGVVLGFRATPLWIAQLVQGYAVTDAAAMTKVLPPAVVLAGVAAATARHLLLRQRLRAAAEIEAAQRSAATLERARLARELHDSVAKTVRGMSMAALALPRSVGDQPQVALQLADAISSAAEAAERETRALLSGLRLDAPVEAFAGTVERLCRVWSAESGIPVHVDVAAVDPPVPVRYELARILHEALTNVARHARARRVLVMIRRQDRMLALTVRDDGDGFAVPEDVTGTDHHGLVGMAERARAIGGRFQVVSTPGRGTIVTVRAPA